MSANLDGYSVDKEVTTDGSGDFETFKLGDITVKKPNLWWPVGYGEQYLYNLTVTSDSSKIWTQVGIRKTEMVQEEIECIEHTEVCNDTNKGLTYFFRVNGVEVYAKGANVVPMDYYPSRMNQNEELEWLVYSAK